MWAKFHIFISWAANICTCVWRAWCRYLESKKFACQPWSFPSYGLYYFHSVSRILPTSLMHCSSLPLEKNTPHLPCFPSFLVPDFNSVCRWLLSIIEFLNVERLLSILGLLLKVFAIKYSIFILFTWKINGNMQEMVLCQKHRKRHTSDYLYLSVTSKS